MKKIILLFGLLLLITGSLFAQDIIELDDPRQSMCISGKGPGQDGAINPYLDSNSVGIVENIGRNEFSMRVQKGEDVIEIIPIGPGEKKEVDLPKGYVLYFDNDLKAKASVAFREITD